MSNKISNQVIENHLPPKLLKSKDITRLINVLADFFGLSTYLVILSLNKSKKEWYRNVFGFRCSSYYKHELTILY
ncbi:hypothetical protein [Methanobrevibacter curvatus]|uniref:Uncharacterized protein n=1 Tax=Methanobrevibacter curvatus TaxID=49547 RepID=A0A166C063_9EURY|nr:hypothetical protein [Methanobrevibacter curvatus]KZX10257.1 hypothetical protein MBCUR_18640 [Methanobrevibacter curvatus]